MTRWITADWHLGETRFDLMQRPLFYTAQDMVDCFVDCHNEVVKPDDEVFVLGDVCNKDAPEFLEQVSRFNGQKVLIRGNHDRGISDAKFGHYFSHVVSEGEGTQLFVGEDQLKCWLTHYPTRGHADMFNLVGHIHGAWKFQKNAVNVGVDANHYVPHNLDKDIPFYFNAICNHYDDDVWAHEHPTQAAYASERGVEGSYFKEEEAIL